MKTIQVRNIRQPIEWPRSGAETKTLSWPVYVRSDPKPPKIAFGTQLAGTPAWQIFPVRPDSSMLFTSLSPGPLVVSYRWWWVSSEAIPLVHPPLQVAIADQQHPDQNQLQDFNRQPD